MDVRLLGGAIYVLLAALVLLVLAWIRWGEK